MDPGAPSGILARLTTSHTYASIHHFSANCAAFSAESLLRTKSRGSEGSSTPCGLEGDEPSLAHFRESSPYSSWKVFSVVTIVPSSA